MRATSQEKHSNRTIALDTLGAGTPLKLLSEVLYVSPARDRTTRIADPDEASDISRLRS
jgi:hypothetical protein